MTRWIVLFAVTAGLAASSVAFALPVTKLVPVTSIMQARTVCDGDGNCWREVSPAEGIVGGILGGIEGRSVHRGDERDFDRDRYRDRDDRDEHREGGDGRGDFR